MAERIAGARNRVVQKARVRKDGWTRERRRRFLAALAESCNVRLACDIAGLAPSSAYDLRRRDPAFAELWGEALAQGYDTLEAALLSHALIGVNAIAIGEPGPDDAGDGVPAVPGSGFAPRSLNPASVQLALALLNRHRQGVDGKPFRGRQRPTAAETDAALKKQLDALARQLNAAKPDDAV